MLTVFNVVEDVRGNINDLQHNLAVSFLLLDLNVLVHALQVAFRVFVYLVQHAEHPCLQPLLFFLHHFLQREYCLGLHVCGKWLGFIVIQPIFIDSQRLVEFEHLRLNDDFLHCHELLFHLHVGHQ